MSSTRGLDGETEVAGWSAAQTRGQLSVGGRLSLTPSRLVFVPNRIDATAGRKMWQCDLGSVQRVERAERGGPILGGGIRRRLLVGHDGALDHFVVNKVDTVVETIRQAIARA